MNKKKKLVFFLILILLVNCSFDTKTGIWTGEKTERKKGSYLPSNTSVEYDIHIRKILSIIKWHKSFCCLELFSFAKA